MLLNVFQDREVKPALRNRVFLSFGKLPVGTRGWSISESPLIHICQPSTNQVASLQINVQQFRGGIVLKAHRLCASLNSRLESNKEEGEKVKGLRSKPSKTPSSQRLKWSGLVVMSISQNNLNQTCSRMQDATRYAGLLEADHPKQKFPNFPTLNIKARYPLIDPLDPVGCFPRVCC